jgi:non-ribosomal peptide synthetase component F
LGQEPPASSLRLVIVGGDVFPVDTLPVWRASGVRVLNAYGPTEAVITATVHELSYQPTACARVPIGRPKPGLSAYVLDECGRFAPLGVPGELYLAGPMLASGYLHDPELTPMLL